MRSGNIGLLGSVLSLRQTGRPNVDWCEDNKEATIRSNVVGTVNLADCCFLKGVHMTNFATGGTRTMDSK